MTETKIVVAGVGSAVFVYDMTEKARLLSFPDGVARRLSLTQRQWEIFDLWQQEYATIIDASFRFAQELAVELDRDPECFEKDLRTSFKALINMATRHYSIENQRYQENDNGATA